MLQVKQCTKCKEFKPLTEFSKNKRGNTYSVRGACKTCRAEAARAEYANNPEKHRAIVAKYRHLHPEKAREINRKSHCKNAVQQREYARVRREHYKKLVKNWRDRNREYYNIGNRRREQARRARKKNAVGFYTDADICYRLEQQGERCFWCSQPLNSKWHIDHVIPLKQGGSNWLKNVVCACPKCNASKHDKLPYTEWQPPNPLISLCDLQQLLDFLSQEG